MFLKKLIIQAVFASIVGQNWASYKS